MRRQVTVLAGGCRVFFPLGLLAKFGEIPSLRSITLSLELGAAVGQVAVSPT